MPGATMDDRPPEPSQILGEKCRGCQNHKAPARWYQVFGGTARGDALGLEADESARICPDCEERLRAWLAAGRDR